MSCRVKSTEIIKVGDKAIARLSYSTPAELAQALDNYAGLSLELAWEIANNPDHPMHMRFGFEALKLIVQAVTPKRREISGGDGGPIELSLSSLFYRNSIPSDGKA